MLAIIKSIIIMKLNRTCVRDVMNKPLYFQVVAVTNSRTMKIPA